ncbi:MAG: exopolysaccharide biosynthesis protein, partial [Gammaproteobacteria bacterium]
MAGLVRKLKERYPSRLVLFDLPPMLAGDDVLAFSPNLDAILMVIKDGATRKKELAKAMELLKDANILGTVLNDANEDVA